MDQIERESKWLLDEKYSGEKCDAFFADHERLITGEPLAYIIGHIPFLSATIYLDSHPLIPRTETEYWVQKAIEDIQSSEIQNPKILDLCAGSGCIGVSLLKHLENSLVDFAEIDETHHSTIKNNILENQIEISRTNIFGGNLYEQITKTYDYILTNPPYIDPEIHRTEESVIKHEPKLALYGGEKGLEFIEQIISESPKYLKDHGVLYIEHEPEQEDAISKIAKPHGFLPYSSSDQFGLIRYTKLTRI